MTKTRERRRMEGLRILARIIARHYLANPHLYRNGAGRDEFLASDCGGATADGDAARKEGAA